MEWIDGLRCTNPQGIRTSGIDVDEFIRCGVVSGMRQLLEVRTCVSVYERLCVYHVCMGLWLLAYQVALQEVSMQRLMSATVHDLAESLHKS